MDNILSSLFKLKAVNCLLDKKPLSADPKFVFEQKINNRVLDGALEYAPDFKKYTLRYMPYRLAKIGFDCMEAEFAEKCFYRNQVMFKMLDNVIDEIYSRNRTPKINLINLGAGLEWKLDSKVKDYQDKLDLRYTAVDLPETMEIRKKIFENQFLYPVVCHEKTSIHTEHGRFENNHPNYFVSDDLNYPMNIRNIISGLQLSDVNIVWSDELMQRLPSEKAEYICQQFIKAGNTVFIFSKSTETTREDAERNGIEIIQQHSLDLKNKMKPEFILLAEKYG